MWGLNISQQAGFTIYPNPTKENFKLTSNNNGLVHIYDLLGNLIYTKEKTSSLCDITCYHPFDLPWLSFYFFTTLKPHKYIITRHDIWPGHIMTAKILKISIYYINANIHKNSLWYKKSLRFFVRYFFKKINVLRFLQRLVWLL